MLKDALGTTIGSDLGDASAHRLPDAIVLAEGGAICSSIAHGAHTPSIDVVQSLCERLPARVRSLFGYVEILAPENGLCMSREVSLERIEEFVHRVQQVLREQRRNVIALVGSHKAPRFASALTVGLSPSDLDSGNNGSTDDRRLSVLLASSRYSEDVDSSGVHTTVEDAFRLSADPHMQGRAGVLYGDHLYAMPGLRRPEEPDELHSRFLTIADKTRHNHWQFTAMRKHHHPIGDVAPFSLEPGVKTFVLGGEREQSSDSVVNAVLAEKWEGSLKGMVLKNTDLRNPFIVTDPAILASINDAGIPGIVVGDSDEPDVLGSAFPRLLDGRNLNSGEAKLLLAYWLKGAEGAGCGGVEETIDYVRQKLDAYPFR